MSVGRRATHPYARTERVAAVLQEVIAEALERLVDRDERLAFVTVTHVVVSSDLRHADVLIASGTAATLEALDEARGELQRAVAREVRLKRTPALRFGLDAQLAAVEELEAVFRRVHEAATDDPGHLPRR